MLLNVSRIDERIEKLQELRRIASDPELLALLQEFITAEPSPAESPKLESVDHDKAAIDQTDKVARQAIETAVEPELLQTGGGIWGMKRR